MALPVDVRSIDDPPAVREALILFADDGGGALGAMDAELRRCINWLTHDQRLYWQAEVERRRESSRRRRRSCTASRSRRCTARTPTTPNSARMSARPSGGSRRPRTSSSSSTAGCRSSSASRDGYGGPARTFADALEFEVGRSIEMLDRMIVALEEYTQICAARDGPPGVGPLASSAAPSSSAPSAATVAEKPAAERDGPRAGGRDGRGP